MMRVYKKPKSLEKQLLIRFFIVLATLIAVLGLYQYVNMRRYLYGSKIQFLDSRFKNIDKKVILGSIDEDLLMKNVKYFLNEVIGEDVCVAVINSSGEIVASKNTYNSIPTDTSKDNNKVMAVPILNKEEYLKILKVNGLASGYKILKDSDGKTQLVIWRQIGNLELPSGLIQISTYMESTDNILFAQIKMYIGASIFILVIGTFLQSTVLKYTLKPLNEMTQTLDKIDTEKLNVRLNDNNGQIEIDKLARNFNNMFQKLELAFNQEKITNEKMKNFILDASHELRTPLTSIQGFIEILQMGAAKNKEQLDLSLDSMLTESQRLTKLVNNLLLLIKLEDKHLFEKKKENISEIIREIYPNLIMLSKERFFYLNLGEELYSVVNKDQIKQVIYNLVQNAINYTKDDGEIEISTKETIKNNINYVEISVKDNGEGIAEENLKLIFDRFFRVEKHRSRKKGGYGLGLSIVKSIVDAHGGLLEIKSQLGKGSEFLVYFKLL